MKISITKTLAVIALLFAVLSAFTPVPFVMAVVLLCVSVIMFG